MPGAEEDLSLPSSTVASFRSSSKELSEEIDDDWRSKCKVYICKSQWMNHTTLSIALMPEAWSCSVLAHITICSLQQTVPLDQVELLLLSVLLSHHLGHNLKVAMEGWKERKGIECDAGP